MPSCKLIIVDEVNIKVEGLSIEVRRKLVNAFKYQDPTARYRPAFKLGRWDGSITMFGIGGNGYLSQLPTILDILEKNNVTITNIEDNRLPVNLEFTNVTEQYWSDQGKIWPPGHPAEGTPIMLRDYQVEAINIFLTNPQSLQAIATGAGKTIITATLSQLCEPIGRTITIVPNKSLVEQTEEDFINVGLDVGVYYGDRKELNKTHTICTWQSLNILDKKSKDDDSLLTLAEFLDGIQAVIVDECFSEDSKVLTPTGYVDIKDIKVGDVIINYSEKTNTFKTDTVVFQHKNLTNSNDETMYELTFDNNCTIKVTGNHKFLTMRGWVRADQLTDTDEIINTYN